MLIVALMNCLGENPYKVNVEQITKGPSCWQKYLSDEIKELQALYALQALMVQMEQPASEFFLLFSHMHNDIAFLMPERTCFFCFQLFLSI